jgi:hypothetical protein
MLVKSLLSEFASSPPLKAGLAVEYAVGECHLLLTLYSIVKYAT